MLYACLLRYPGTSFGIANLHDLHLISAELMDTGRRLEIRHEATRDVIEGLPERSPDPIGPVIRIRTRPKSAAQRRAARHIGLADPDAILD